MKIEQLRWTEKAGWEPRSPESEAADLVLVFADHPHFHSDECYANLAGMFPVAHILGCSSSGSVMGTVISDGDMVATIVKFQRTKVRMCAAVLTDAISSTELASDLMQRLAGPDLRHVVVLSDGLQINGSDLAQGLNRENCPVSGGLAGDGTRFSTTWVMADAPAQSGRVAALGFYGDIQIKSGCFAGWEEFGAERVVTKSVGNVVFEIDGQPALPLYMKYLGELAAELPASGLRFPLSIQAGKTERALLRTLLGIDEAAQSLTFAGDVPEGWLCKLMRTNLDRLIEHAGMAADAATPPVKDATGLCLIVSCVGRRLVMGQLTEEELEIVQLKLGDATTLAGFYSYGELAPFSSVLKCQLHNQTMTLSTFYE
ncbi:MAG: FIST N-terminal domain-containing protein [Gallionella sp.]